MAQMRRAEREVINRYLRVFEKDSERFLGYLVDITPVGAMVQRREAIEPEVRMKLRFELPKELDVATEVVVEAESIWDRKEENALFHHTGFQFKDVGPDQEEKIRLLMENYRLEGLSH